MKKDIEKKGLWWVDTKACSWLMVGVGVFGVTLSCLGSSQLALGVNAAGLGWNGARLVFGYYRPAAEGEDQ